MRADDTIGRGRRREGKTDEDSMIELDGRRVLEHVTPPAVREVRSAGITGWVVELRERRDDTLPHLRELVVDQASIESGDEGACRTRKGKQR
jgi:hypothetical protein